MLVDIDIAKGETTKNKDKDLILAQIRALPGGEHGCNVDLKALMRRWVFETLGEAVRDSERALVGGGISRAVDSIRADFECQGARLEHAELLNAVALVETTNGTRDYTKALELHGQALAIYEEVHGKHHPKTARTYNNMAMVYDAQGDHTKALEFYRRALAIREEVHGKDHPSVARTYNGMAIVYRAQGDHAKALEFYRQALAIDEEVYGKHHPTTASRYYNMAVIYKRQGDHTKALEFYRPATARPS